MSFPDVAGSVVIFGLGYAVDVLADIGWLHGKQLHYWGDVDTHGFSILSRMRSYFPSVHSMMMDQSTLTQFTDLCVLEPDASRCSDVLMHLRTEEALLYQQLQLTHQRLEQERLPMRYVLECLESIFS